MQCAMPSLQTTQISEKLENYCFLILSTSHLAKISSYTFASKNVLAIVSSERQKPSLFFSNKLNSTAVKFLLVYTTACLAAYRENLARSSL